MLVYKDVFWHNFDNISNYHNIEHVYNISSHIEILFYHATEIISKETKLDTI
jgi:hypothetical protein